MTRHESPSRFATAQKPVEDIAMALHVCAVTLPKTRVATVVGEDRRSQSKREVRKKK